MTLINIDKPRWDQSTYLGRLKYYFTTTNPMNLLRTSSSLEKAKEIVLRQRNGEYLDLSEEEIWRAKHLYDSAFHPETCEKMILIGRMSAQVPMNMFITGCMLTFYKTTPQVVFWQWFNQSFNAVVNYTNRSDDSPLTVNQLGTSYILATFGALATALSLNNLVKSSPPLIRRFVPFCAVAAANCINVPMMRIKELQEGIPVVDENGIRIGNSQTAAKFAISQVVISRVGMAVPTMLIPPIIMNFLDQKGILRKYPRINTPLQITICGLLLTFATPFCCAIFPQKGSIKVQSLESNIRETTDELTLKEKYLYYNKGL
ncbi:sideroflexin-1-like [Parasteatoda tepidariorum]|uniref:sideroflexin-1-like n=1 Tax=Parasteatoda tepidariorum TaxID=114398 RepID=UPI00077FCF46|nr:sideroflexin-1-like [Parasteatoda tepidariorum]